jgi:hypothetical protein
LSDTGPHVLASRRYVDNVRFRDPVADAAAPTYTDFLLVFFYFPVMVSELELQCQTDACAAALRNPWQTQSIYNSV